MLKFSTSFALDILQQPLALLKSFSAEDAQRIAEGILNAPVSGIGLVLGDAACYVLGTAWFVFQMQCELGYALSVCVYPFIALDLAKIVVSCIVGALLRKRLVQAGVLKLKEA